MGYAASDSPHVSAVGLTSVTQRNNPRYTRVNHDVAVVLTYSGASAGGVPMVEPMSARNQGEDNSMIRHNRYPRIPPYPFTVVDIPQDAASIRYLIERLKEITGTKGCPGISDELFIKYCIADTERYYLGITIDPDCHMYRSRTTRFRTVSYKSIISASEVPIRKELTT